MKRNETTIGLNSSLAIPTDRTYSLQCVEEEFKKFDGSGNYGIQRKWQIIAPEKVEINGQEVDVTGTDITQFVMTRMVAKDGRSAEARTASAMGRLYKDYDILLGYECDDDIDPSNPKLIAKGKVIDATLKNEEYTKTYPVSPEDIAAGRKVGKPILDEDGKEIKAFKRVFGSILGLSRVAPVPF